MIHIYEVIENDIVVSRVVADEAFMLRNYSEYRLADDHLTIIESQVRNKRDSLLLTLVDPIASNVLRWSDLSVEEQQTLTEYRSALLDIPQQSGFPTDVVWPAIPNFIKQTSEVTL